MKKEILNGTPIPYDLPIKDLEEMMNSSVMKDFSLACEALSYKNDPAAYRIMKSHIDDNDKYRRLYVLKTIFRHSEAYELIDFLENAIASDDFLFVKDGLTVISDYKIKVSEQSLTAAVSKHLPKLYSEIRALSTLDVSSDNYVYLTELFKEAKLCIQREIIAEILIEKYLITKPEGLFDLFRRDGFAKIRLLALKIAENHGYSLSSFFSDMDGHVKKLLSKSLGNLSFLDNYISRLRVDISDDLNSAVIYNPNSEEHLYIAYDSADESFPYTLSFSFQHVHQADQKSAAEWIEDILSERLFSIEFFLGEDRRFGGQISASDLNKLSYEFLEQYTGYYGSTKLFHIADNFKVSGWTEKNDFHAFFTKNGKAIHIKRVSKA